MWTYLAVVFSVILVFASSQNNNLDHDCICVHHTSCRDGIIITDGSTQMDARIGKNCNNNETCCTVKPTQSSKLKKCGYRNPDGVGFKISGDANEVAFGEFPWMVGILDTTGRYRCGGSLIHPSVVLTAAHCITLNSSFIARAGEWDSSKTTEILKHQDRSISSVKIHERYSYGNYFNDVALLFLSSPFDLAAHISVVCLPPSNTIVDNAQCYATGWGKTRFGVEDSYPAMLKAVELPMVPRSTCQEKLRKTRVGSYFQLHESFVCAGGEKGLDTCTGDGGGPLVCPIEGEDERYQQVGIVAWGIGCSTENVPGVYAHVAHFRSWIDRQIKNKNFDVQSYQY